MPGKGFHLSEPALEPPAAAASCYAPAHQGRDALAPGPLHLPLPPRIHRVPSSLAPSGLYLNVIFGVGGGLPGLPPSIAAAPPFLCSPACFLFLFSFLFLFLFLLLLFLFFFWLLSWLVESPRPGIETSLQLQPAPLPQRRWILNPLLHRGTNLPCSPTLTHHPFHHS